MIIPYGRQDINQNDIEEVVKTLKSDFITQGPKIVEFENKISQYCGSKHAASFNSATSALHCACKSINIPSDGLVWTSPNSFVASANCAIYEGLKIDFIDIDQSSYNICPQKIEDKIKKGGKSPNAIIVVDYAGQPCNLAEIKQLSIKYGFKIIEDASHAIGASYQGKKIGNCQFSDIVIFSFHPVKIMTTGEGGMALTNDPNIDRLLKLYRSHGITRDKSEMLNDKFKNDPWYYEQIKLGYNYRMTDIVASLGISQLKRLDQFTAKRNEIAKIYNKKFSDLPLKLPKIKSDRTSSYHLYPILCKDLEEKREIFSYLRKNGIMVNSHYIPIHTQPFYQKLGFKWGDFKNAEDFYLRQISIPMFSSMTEEEINCVINKIKEFYGSPFRRN
jgi:UDP-4-amino-4,6-dideoxy-N-acetyl-beta-L-altrosamine transaminase